MTWRYSFVQMAPARSFACLTHPRCHEERAYEHLEELCVESALSLAGDRVRGATPIRVPVQARQEPQSAKNCVFSKFVGVSPHG